MSNATSSTATASATLSAPAPTISAVFGSGQADVGIGVIGLLTAIGTSSAVFAVQMGLFEFLRNRLARI
jgi:hypothetical protein